jgi:hypothetical protein
MRRVAILLLLPLLLAGCGKTAGEVIAENKAKADAVRETLATALSMLPPPGESLTAVAGMPDPKPFYEVQADYKVSANAAFLTPEEIKASGKPAYDLILSSDLAYVLAWTGPNNPMSETALEGPENDLPATFGNALATPYAIIYRPVAYNPPVAEDEKNFSGGTLDLEAFLVRLSDGTPLVACRIQAASDTSVSYTYKQGDDPKERLVAFASSTLRDDAMKTLAQCLNDKTGGTFKF